MINPQFVCIFWCGHDQMAFSLCKKVKELWQKFESFFLINFELDFTEASIVTRQDIEEDLSMSQPVKRQQDRRRG